MKETLTVRRPSVVAAIQRGDERCMEIVRLREVGTEEQVWADEVRRGALLRWDILKRRALYPAIEPSRVQLLLNAEKLMKEKLNYGL